MKCHTKYTPSIWKEKSTKVAIIAAVFTGFGFALIWSGKVQGDAINNLIVLGGFVGSVLGFWKKDEPKP
jgi:predicted alpha/beta hydrolase